MSTKLYHLLVLKFGGVKSAILIGGLLCILLLCGFAALLCYFHLKMLDKRNPKSRVHRAPVPPQRKAFLSKISIEGIPPTPNPVSNEDSRSNGSFRKVQGADNDDVTAKTIPLRQPLREPLREAEKPKADLKLVSAKVELSTPEKGEYIKGHINASMHLLAETSRRVNSLELIMGDRMYLANTVVNRDLIQARRIIRAIHSRVRKLDALVAAPTEASVDAAYTLACSDLDIPKDTVNALLDADALEPIEPGIWMKVLDSLLSEAENCVQAAINQ